ncbi:Aste57867_11739 [Aphanomyces stellatus]|uniref:Aste57867_11739 protein n=1 Tax=Aphanomyces stellatus TaxID=120398 RepID=A0A485KUC1_9STRA|nr:hypothetical protein As57867_011695 [Aphanomyces stellatus]VFT88595.1 Aste57867_11739 [Aphanomyces stellatus]
MQQFHLGVLNAVGAYVIWGVFPIYWKQLQDIPAIQLCMHRMVWSLAMLVVYIFASQQWTEFRRVAFTWRNAATYTLSGLLICANWLIFVWAVNAGYVVEASLGYFINPLLTVIIGVVFFKETLRRGQMLAIAIAVVGVLILSISYGKFPWISLSLALTFAGYGFVKKRAPLSSMQGLTMETAILFLPALVYLVVVEVRGTGAFLHVDAVSNVLIVGGGLVTVIPLLLFSSAAKQIPLTTLGLLQYTNPILQFLCGVVIYHEPFSTTKLIGFVFVWVALMVFVAEGFYDMRQTKAEEGVDSELAIVEDVEKSTDFELMEPGQSPGACDVQSTTGIAR